MPVGPCGASGHHASWRYGTRSRPHRDARRTNVIVGSRTRRKHRSSSPEVVRSATIRCHARALLGAWRAPHCTRRAGGRTPSQVGVPASSSSTASPHARRAHPRATAMAQAGGMPGGAGAPSGLGLHFAGDAIRPRVPLSAPRRGRPAGARPRPRLIDAPRYRASSCRDHRRPRSRHRRARSSGFVPAGGSFTSLASSRIRRQRQTSTVGGRTASRLNWSPRRLPGIGADAGRAFPQARCR